jgi:hypothetical protein
MHDINCQGPIHIVTGDLRHWFHQLPLDTEFIRSHFGIVMQGHPGEPNFSGAWRSLPMGFNWAPYAAQGAAWCFLSHREPNQEPIMDEEAFTYSHLPTFVPLIHNGQQVGFVTVFYDNYLIVTHDRSAAQAAHNRLQQNAATLKIQLKCHEFFEASVLQKREVSYLGVQFSLKKIRSSGAVQFRWRHDTDRFVRYQQCFEGMLSAEMVSTRRIAEAVGRVVYHELMALRPLTSVSPIINLLREAVKRRNATGSSWDDEIIEADVNFKKLIKTFWSEAAPNPWCALAVRSSPSSTIHCASDSSDAHWGFCTLAVTGRQVTTPIALHYDWPEGLASCHIYVKECLAAIKALMHLSAMHGPGTHFVIGIDNTAAASALSRLYSPNLLVTSHMTSLYELMKSKCHTFSVGGLRSEDNAADPFSRKLDVCPRDLAARCFDILSTRHERGFLINRYDYLAAPSNPEGNERHPAGEDGAEAVWEDLNPELESLIAESQNEYVHL